MLSGILLGMIFLVMGANPRNQANKIYHRVTLVVTVISIAFLFIPADWEQLTG